MFQINSQRWKSYCLSLQLYPILNMKLPDLFYKKLILLTSPIPLNNICNLKLLIGRGMQPFCYLILTYLNYTYYTYNFTKKQDLINQFTYISHGQCQLVCPRRPTLNSVLIQFSLQRIKDCKILKPYWWYNLFPAATSFPPNSKIIFKVIIKNRI